MEDPLNGKSEGWPAPGPDAIFYLAKKGIRCVATDAPTLGGVEPKRALMTYWALGGKGMAGVEYLTNVGQMPQAGVLPVRRGEDPRLPRGTWAGDRTVLRSNLRDLE